MSDWIKCSERLPELGVEVMAADIYKEIAIGHYFLGYQDKLCFSDSGDHLGTITHWQPLPGPPTE